MAEQKAARFTVAQVKVGDILTGGELNQGGRHYDWRYKVLVKGGAHRLFEVVRLYENDREGLVERMTGAQLTAGNWNTVWRGGQKVGAFCVKYW